MDFKSNYFKTFEAVTFSRFLTAAESRVATGFICWFNPQLKYPRSSPTYKDIAKLTNLSLCTVKKAVPKIVKLFPNIFKQRQRSHDFGKYEYTVNIDFKTSVRGNITTQEEVPIGDTEITEQDLYKMQILNKLNSSVVSVNQLREFLKYDVKTIHHNVAYLVEQQKKRDMSPGKFKNDKLYIQYIRKCFEENWGFNKFASKSARDEAVKDLLAQVNPDISSMVNQLTDKLKFKDVG
jgi:hypothetical protein